MHYAGQPVGYQSLALTTGASGLGALPGDTLAADAMLVRVEGCTARFTTVGGTANIATTATTGGMPLFPSDQPLWIEGKGNLLNFSVIAAVGTGNLHVLYFACTRR